MIDRSSDGFSERCCQETLKSLLYLFRVPLSYYARSLSDKRKNSRPSGKLAPFSLTPHPFPIPPHPLSRRQEVAKVLPSSPPTACPQCQSPLVVELDAYPDGEEALDATTGIGSIESGGGGGGGGGGFGGGNSGGGGDVTAETVERRGEEVARISWMEKSSSDPKDHEASPGG